MTPVAQWIADEYEAALRDYMTGSGEAALQRAYELGRRAVKEGLSLFDLVSRHHAALQQALQWNSRGIRDPRPFEAAQTFLAESLSTFEMAHREFQDAISALRQMNQRLEEEVQRIAHALHDEAGQLLVSVHLSLHALCQEHPPASDAIRAVRGQLDEVEHQLRRLAHELRPPVLDDLGLLPALEELARGVTSRTRIPVEVTGSPPHRLPSLVESTVYRVVQEALTNATRHGMPRRVWVCVERAPKGVRCRVRDDGIGFDAPLILNASKRWGLGLTSMRERVSALGGHFAIHSAPGRGCELTLEIPLEANDADAPTARG